MSNSGHTNALYLSDDLDSVNSGASFLDRIDPGTLAQLRAGGTTIGLQRGQVLFSQGEAHAGVWLIEEGTLRTYYVGAQGRELTLAYWTHGHFVGGPEIFGGGRHIWSADAARTASVIFLPGGLLRRLAERDTQMSLALIDGLIAKGKCYSALVQILATRSATERLRMMLEIMAETHGRRTPEGVVIERPFTLDELAQMLGTSRQWLSVSMDKLRAEGVLATGKRQITLLTRPAPLEKRGIPTRIRPLTA